MTMSIFSLLIILLFVALFVVSWSALKMALIFGDKSNFVIALCVASLCIISIHDFVPPDSGLEGTGRNNTVTVVSPQEKMAGTALIKPEKQEGIRIILLPYQALLIAISGLFLILALAKIWSLCRKFMSCSSLHNKRNSKHQYPLKKQDSIFEDTIKTVLKYERDIK